MMLLSQCCSFVRFNQKYGSRARWIAIAMPMSVLGLESSTAAIALEFNSFLNVQWATICSITYCDG